MSDTANCMLYYSSDLTAAEEDDLDRLCRKHYGERSCGRCYHFLDVNYAYLEDDIAEWFRSRGKPYAWASDRGDDYHSGVEIYDPATGLLHEMPTLDNEIVIRVSDIGGASGLVEEAKAANDLWNTIIALTETERAAFLNGV